jgi:cell pole-organizing protein PopZ
MAKPQPAADPSIEDMLSTIRKAIDEETAKTAQATGQTPPVSGSMREMRVSLETGDEGQQGGVKTRSDDFMKSPLPPPEAPAAKTRVTGAGKPFGGIMGGDVRLEEALSRSRRQETLQATAPQPRIIPERPTLPERQAPAASIGGIRQSINDTLLGRSATPSQPARQSQPERPQPPVAPVPPSPAPAPTSAARATSVPPPWPKISIGPEPAPPPPEPQIKADAEPTTPVVSEPVMSEQATQAATEAFNRLSEELFLRSMGGSDQLAAAAREMVRPMLKAWLDENLPSLVERLVREEIERVVRRGGH